MFQRQTSHEPATQASALGYGLAAYLIWGFSPLYFQLLSAIAPLEILAHRVVWSVGLLAIFLSLQRCWGEIRVALAHRPTLWTLTATAVLLSVNWFTFIYCVTRGYLLQSSMGYFIAPLLSMVLGIVFLRERLRGAQLLSLVLVVVAIVYLVTRSADWPTLALILAGSGSFYALLRKWNQVTPVVGGMIETAILLPLATPYVVWEFYRAAAVTHSLTGAYALLPLTSLATGLPLLLFAIAARRLKLTTIGFLQYITPTCHFLVALVQGRETVSPQQWVTFGMIWVALAIYSVDSWRAQRAAATPPSATLEP